MQALPEKMFRSYTTDWNLLEVTFTRSTFEFKNPVFVHVSKEQTLNAALTLSLIYSTTCDLNVKDTANNRNPGN